MSQSIHEYPSSAEGDLPASNDKPDTHDIYRQINYQVALDHLIKHPPFGITINGNANDVHFALNVALLPQADELNRYETALPGAAGYIMNAAEEQRRHRHGIENRLVDGSERRRDRSQLISGGLSFTGLVAAAALGVLGNPWIAGLMAVIAVGGPLAAQQMAGAIAQAGARQEPERTEQAPSVRTTSATDNKD